MNKNCNHKWEPSCSFSHPYRAFTAVVLYICKECGATYISNEPRLFAPKIKKMGTREFPLKKAS